MLKEREEAWGAIENLARQNPKLEKLSTPDVLNTNVATPTELEPVVDHVTDVSKVMQTILPVGHKICIV